MTSREHHFYLFRHGQTDWNLARRFQGHTDIPLNETGREQARAFADLLDRLGLEVDVVVTSDLRRARETAEIAFGARTPPVEITETPDLREAHLGEVEGLLAPEIEERWGNSMLERFWSMDPADLDHGFPGGETKRTQLERIRAHLESLASATDHRRIAISTHGGVLSRFLAFSRGGPRERIEIRNCALYHVVRDPEGWHYRGPLGAP